jgi:hypothetical protein
MQNIQMIITGANGSKTTLRENVMDESENENEMIEYALR